MAMQRTFETYTERWKFKIYRDKGYLRARGTGHDLKWGEFESLFQYQDKAWKLKRLVNVDCQQGEVPGEVEKEMFREFAAYKARYLAASGRKSTPKAKENEEPPSPGEGGSRSL